MTTKSPELPPRRDGVAPSRFVQRIRDRTAAVRVIGLGYVGLAVAAAFAAAGYTVIGVERDAKKIDEISHGRYPLHGQEPDLPALIAAQVGAGRLSATADYAVCSDADVIIVCVETPIDAATHRPTYQALRGVLASLGGNLRPGTLLSFESTLAPGTTRDLIVPMLEETTRLSAGDDLLVVCCPERVMPGKLLRNLACYGRVIGAFTPAAGEAAHELYRTITAGRLNIVDCTTAELVKTTENAYRDVQIAFANEVALLCERYGSNAYTVRQLVRDGADRDMHLPGAGVGGHCIPKDPWLLVSGAGAELARLIPTARAINDSMPAHLAALAARALAQHGQTLAGSRVAVLGFAYLENSDDTRNSPTELLLEALNAAGVTDVRSHDPFVAEYQGVLADAIHNVDCVIVMVAHDAYRDMSLAELCAALRTPVLIDGRHIYTPEAAVAAGLTYRCIGIGPDAGKVL